LLSTAAKTGRPGAPGLAKLIGHLMHLVVFADIYAYCMVWYAFVCVLFARHVLTWTLLLL